MRMITIEQIVKATKCNAQALRVHYPSILSSCEAYQINTPQRISAFLANAIHETQGFMSMSENLNYKDPARVVQVFRKFDLDKDRVIDPGEIEFAKGYVKNPIKLANYVYGGRYGNSEEGDGWKFRGRGVFHTTFHDNYKYLTDALGFDFISDPDKLIEAPYAAKSAAFFWNQKKLNRLADLEDMKAITIAINGGLNGYEYRLKYYNAILKLYED